MITVYIEEVNETVSKRVFYLPHRPAIGESTETAKIRIVYNVSVKACQTSASLNECLEAGPPMKNQRLDIIIRTWFRPILHCGDIEKEFLQIRIRESHRDVLRFHWASNLDLNWGKPFHTLSFWSDAVTFYTGRFVKIAL